MNEIDILNNKVKYLLRDFKSKKITSKEAISVFSNIIEEYKNINGSEFFFIEKLENSFFKAVSKVESYRKIIEEVEEKTIQNKFLRSQLGLV